MSTLFRGLNAGVTVSAVHDSSIGWYNVVTSAAGYTISPHYSADASLSVYPYPLVQNRNPAAPPGQTLVTVLGDLGDTFVGLHASFHPRILNNTTTALFTIPTGNQADGLAAGKATFDFSDRMERYFGQTGLLLEVGAGDSSALFNRLVMNDYTTVGAIVHFQGGAIVWRMGGPTCKPSRTSSSLSATRRCMPTPDRLARQRPP